MILTDTIIAISSPPGPARRGIVRITGPNSWTLASQLLPLPTPLTPGWHANLPLPLLHPTAKIAHALLFKSPRSFTGQDIAELHLPASPALLNALIEKALSLAPGKLRLADPGEFSARAFFNGKIDLTQAEGIAATINASNESQLRAAASLRSGHLHQWIAATTEKIAELLAGIEAGIDFVDEEDVSFFDPYELRRDLANLLMEVLQHQLSARRLESYNELPTIVLTGRPNVGKSSLLNVLTNSQRAIVSPIAGTTRDALASIMTTPAGDMRIVDVAGIETAAGPLSERMNTARHHALATADLIINVESPDVPREGADPSERPEGIPTIQVLNKSDLLKSDFKPLPYAIRVSTKTGEGIDQLRARIIQILAPAELAGTQRAILNQRHREILSQFDLSLDRAYTLSKDAAAAKKHPELLAAELRLSLDLLGQITGTISPDEIIGRIFSQFCIGK